MGNKRGGHPSMTPRSSSLTNGQVAPHTPFYEPCGWSCVTKSKLITCGFRDVRLRPRP
jgi:hypothetical protein